MQKCYCIVIQALKEKVIYNSTLYIFLIFRINKKGLSLLSHHKKGGCLFGLFGLYYLEFLDYIYRILKQNITKLCFMLYNITFLIVRLDLFYYLCNIKVKHLKTQHYETNNKHHHNGSFKKTICFVAQS